MPAIQMGLREQGLAFRCRFHIKDDDPARLADEVVMEDGQGKGGIPDKGIQDPIGLRGRQFARRKRIEKKITPLTSTTPAATSSQTRRCRYSVW